MRKILTHLVFAASVAVTDVTLAQQFESEPTQTTLLELYTSQGCSSCPPAEEYLNSLKDHPRLWKDFIPIALHVDYWDYIGWKDRFADPSHTLRQRQYARVNAQRTIYTPAFFVNGKPWRRGFFNAVPDASNRQVGTLKVTLENEQVSASFAPPSSSDKKPLDLNLAIVGMGLKTQIRAGENEGRFSRHEFVKLNGVSVTSSNNQWQFYLPKPEKIQAERYALVAWISAQNNPRPLQAVGGYLR